MREKHSAGFLKTWVMHGPFHSGETWSFWKELTPFKRRWMVWIWITLAAFKVLIETRSLNARNLEDTVMCVFQILGFFYWLQHFSPKWKPCSGSKEKPLEECQLQSCCTVCVWLQPSAWKILTEAVKSTWPMTRSPIRRFCERRRCIICMLIFKLALSQSDMFYFFNELSAVSLFLNAAVPQLCAELEGSRVIMKNTFWLLFHSHGLCCSSMLRPRSDSTSSSESWSEAASDPMWAWLLWDWRVCPHQ